MSSPDLGSALQLQKPSVKSIKSLNLSSAFQQTTKEEFTRLAALYRADDDRLILPRLVLDDISPA